MGADPSLTSELIQAQAFTTGFRGYDQAEVRQFLARVAAEVRSIRERSDQLESAWHSAEERAARPPVLDEDTLMAAVGEETGAILLAARATASDLRSRATQEAERIVAEVEERATRIRGEADSLLARQTRAAEEAAARIVESARSQAAELVDKARADADVIRAGAQQERALTIEGATTTRERILDDLSRRRRVASVQIEQLRAGRERLLESYAVVRRTLEEVNSSLNRADAEARAAANEVGRRMQREQPTATRPVGDGVAEGVASGDTAGEDTGAAGTAAAGDTETIEAGEAGGAANTDAAAGPVGAGDRGPATSTNGIIGTNGVAGAKGATGPTETTGTKGVTADTARTPETDPAPSDGDTDPGTQSSNAGGLVMASVAPSPAVAPAKRPAGGIRGRGKRRGRATSPAAPDEAGAAEYFRPEALETGETVTLIVEVQPAPVQRDVPGLAFAEVPTAEEDPPARAGQDSEVVSEATAAAGSQVDVLFARIRAAGSDEPAHAGAAATGGQTESSVGNGQVVTADEPDETDASLPDDAVDAATSEQETPGADARVDSDAAVDTEPARSNGDEALLQQRESAVIDLEVALTRKLKRTLQDEQNDLLDRLRSLRGEPTAARLLPDSTQQVARYASAAQPLVDKAAAAGVTFAAAVLEREVPAPGNAPVVDDVAREAAATIVESLRRRLEHAISVSAGDNQSVLVEALGSAYREWKTERIERVSGDVLAAAFSRGTWNEVPEGTPLRWIVEDTGGPCPDCDDDALAGSLPKGEVFPTGQHYPPAHTGCRCLLVPAPG